MEFYREIEEMQEKLMKKSAAARFRGRLMIGGIVLGIILTIIALGILGYLVGKKFNILVNIISGSVILAVGIALYTVMLKFRYRATRYRMKALALDEITRMLQKDGGEEKFRDKLERLEKVSCFGESDISSEDILLDFGSVVEARYQAYLWVARQIK